jgi:hypothetical protein
MRKVKREFLLQNLGYYLKKIKKKIRRVNIPGWNIFLLGMAGTIRNGLVFKARQNRGVPVPD